MIPRSRLVALVREALELGLDVRGITHHSAYAHGEHLLAHASEARGFSEVRVTTGMYSYVRLEMDNGEIRLVTSASITPLLLDPAFDLVRRHAERRASWNAKSRG